MANEAIIRTGDYPREKSVIDVTVVLSELISSRKVMDYFTRAITYITTSKRRRGSIEYDNRGLEEAFRDIPSLF